MSHLISETCFDFAARAPDTFRESQHNRLAEKSPCDVHTATLPLKRGRLTPILRLKYEEIHTAPEKTRASLAGFAHPLDLLLPASRAVVEIKDKEPEGLLPRVLPFRTKLPHERSRQFRHVGIVQRNKVAGGGFSA